MPYGVNQHVQTALNAPDKFIAILAIAESVVLANDSIRVRKSKRGVGEVKTPHLVARTAFVVIPLEIQASSVVQ